MRARDKFALWLLRDADFLVVHRGDFDAAVKELLHATQLTGHTRRDRKFEQAIARVGGFLLRARRDPWGSEARK